MSYLVSEYDDLDKCTNDSGDIVYYKKNTTIWHNPYGPTIICKDGYIAYLIDGKWHRLDGPSRIYPDGKELYYINGESLTKEEFEIHPERLKYLGKDHLKCLI